MFEKDDDLEHIPDLSKMQPEDQQIYRDNVARRLLQRKRTKAQITAEQIREAMDPEAYIDELIEIKESIDGMDPEQMVKARFKVDILLSLLKKCVPDVKAVELKGQIDRPAEVRIVRFGQH